MCIAPSAPVPKPNQCLSNGSQPYGDLLNQLTNLTNELTLVTNVTPDLLKDRRHVTANLPIPGKLPIRSTPKQPVDVAQGQPPSRPAPIKPPRSRMAKVNVEISNATKQTDDRESMQTNDREPKLVLNWKLRDQIAWNLNNHLKMLCAAGAIDQDLSQTMIEENGSLIRQLIDLKSFDDGQLRPVDSFELDWPLKNRILVNLTKNSLFLRENAKWFDKKAFKDSLIKENNMLIGYLYQIGSKKCVDLGEVSFLFPPYILLTFTPHSPLQCFLFSLPTS